MWGGGGGCASRGPASCFDPKKVEFLAGQHVVAVSAGLAHSLAVTADGAVFAWGGGEDGCLGHGEDLSNQLLPKKVEAWAQELRRE